MPIPIAGALVSAGASIINNGLNSYAVNKANEQNMRNWREMQEYNSPSNQVKRMKEAGLNPALMYQQGNTGNATPPPSSEKNNYDITQIGAIIRTFLELKAADANIENTRTNTAATKVRTEGDELENIKKDIINKYAEDKESTSLQEAQNQERKSGYHVGKYVQEDGTQSPMSNEYDGRMKALASDLDISSKKKVLLDHAIEMTERERWEFINDKKRYAEYGIVPSDPQNVQFMKILSKDIFGMELDKFKDIILNYFK